MHALQASTSHSDRERIAFLACQGNFRRLEKVPTARSVLGASSATRLRLRHIAAVARLANLKKRTVRMQRVATIALQGDTQHRMVVLLAVKDAPLATSGNMIGRIRGYLGILQDVSHAALVGLVCTSKVISGANTTQIAGLPDVKLAPQVDIA